MRVALDCLVNASWVGDDVRREEQRQQCRLDPLRHQAEAIGQEQRDGDRQAKHYRWRPATLSTEVLDLRLSEVTRHRGPGSRA
jgi:hypothetical protein